MNISEARLRQIVLEEVQIRIVEYYIDQEIATLIAEGVKADWDAANWKARKRKMRDAALGAIGIGTGFGALKYATDQHSDTKAANIEKAQQANVEKKSTIENSVEDLNKQAGNFFAWTWKTNDTQTLPFPVNPDNHSEAILPPEWSVVAQVAKDKAAGTPQYEVDQNYLNTAMSPDALAAMYKDVEGSPPPGAAAGFFDDFAPGSHPFSDASEMGAHTFRSNNPGVPSAMVDLDGDGAPDSQNLVYIPFDELPDGYTMPNSGLTKEQMYKQYYYGHGMSLEEFGKLKGETPEETTELNPELIQKTQDRSDSLRLPKDQSTWKENRVTWKNYKNRKKVLA